MKKIAYLVMHRYLKANGCAVNPNYIFEPVMIFAEHRDAWDFVDRYKNTHIYSSTQTGGQLTCGDLWILEVSYCAHEDVNYAEWDKLNFWWNVF